MDNVIEYYSHYIEIDDQSRIICGWSNGPFPNRPTTGQNVILINDRGSYQFRLTADGEENTTE